VYGYVVKAEAVDVIAMREAAKEYQVFERLEIAASAFGLLAMTILWNSFFRSLIWRLKEKKGNRCEAVLR
jgi:hypothetical protein